MRLKPIFGWLALAQSRTLSLGVASPYVPFKLATCSQGGLCKLKQLTLEERVLVLERSAKGETDMALQSHWAWAKHKFRE